MVRSTRLRVLVLQAYPISIKVHGSQVVEFSAISLETVQSSSVKFSQLPLADFRSSDLDRIHVIVRCGNNPNLEGLRFNSHELSEL